MDTHDLHAGFIKRLSSYALQSDAINHPYLDALRKGNLPNIELALKDFAFQYSLYSTRFTEYVAAVIENLSETTHRKILLDNLAEENGDLHDSELPPEVYRSIEGLPHRLLYERFQNALGVDDEYRNKAPQGQLGSLWSQQFLSLCQLNERVGIGAIGIGTELIVSGIYQQILEGLKAHTSLTLEQRVFFDLHSQCDDEHAAQIILITKDLADSQSACEQIEYGAVMAIKMRALFWDKMLERAKQLSSTTPSTSEALSAIGY